MNEVDFDWAVEAECRIDAYDPGEIQAVDLAEVLSRYNSESENDG